MPSSDLTGMRSIEFDTQWTGESRGTAPLFPLALRTKAISSVLSAFDRNRRNAYAPHMDPVKNVIHSDRASNESVASVQPNAWASPRSRARLLCPSGIVLSLLSKRAPNCRRNSISFWCLAIFSLAKFSVSCSNSLSFRFNVCKISNGYPCYSMSLTFRRTLLCGHNGANGGRTHCIDDLRKWICWHSTEFADWTSFSLRSSAAAASSMFRSTPSSGHGGSSPACCAPHAFRPYEWMRYVLYHYIKFIILLTI